MPQPRKRFAQHWLRSETALDQIIEAAQLNMSDLVLEIGPGTGILTRRLLPLVQSIVAVELDRDLCYRLAKSFGNFNHFLLLEGDILSLDLTTQLEQFPQFQPINKVVANIPYNITSPILEKLLGSIAHPQHPSYELIVLLMQKEVAQRIVASPQSKAYGALSVRTQYLAQCDYICEVPSKAFDPPPKVDSAVIRLTPRSLETPAINPQKLDQLVKLGFANRRKMLHNNLKSIIDKDHLTLLLDQLQINPQVRAEELSLEQWIMFSNLLETVS
ncbi:dimethyladenosine transferase [Rippkaea orientalis PCC 8801]|uniref:Ribosomal RNA small subunit methyltransferase A n=1 Tax=Rippkaea orientalis (strain PCC 8801 / RF-1) TaxID=41431 RepID=RSMA_RIPO1|nr:16S rRNA (adenine(1518)-N(6)/adenine(1519)-N(6))-dimethyltransferase RsmA [Rippkaea orientalis]B7JWJ7.1 RecName: Full=Ribosomal RNA small subunit methyltransferase A; AltName: Full=16S rRNA (adenine(1518)-N(6)/adenine(1519)-N(6))-dimethyltransferase; AltName: Full=16S rRNA dimethyladenosine transferase; AltName: Full=16S rRNA dimethylase; AltName: Full=S-adenosylmethionine-6-N', N'-adenosyl(rRNA) dimethyltransferase [Rippkaea orientalis PCC 8801]ACK68338.1 dimethyladenosine transferase [Rippka